MHTSVERLPKSCVKLRVEVPAVDVRPYVERAARELSKDHAPKGFRPGSAPLEVMRNTLGDQVIIERAAKELVMKTYVQTVLEREDIDAIGQPHITIEHIGFDGPCVYEATVAVLPDVTLGDYRNFRSACRPVTVDDSEISRELEHLRKLRASYLTVPRPAQNGDRVEVTITASSGHVPLDLGPQQPQSFLLGEGHLVPGFEEQVLGAKEGETKTFTLTFPEHHHRTDLRGKPVEFRVAMKTVQQRILPTLDDGFAKGLGKFSDLADLKQRLRENVRQEKEQHERERYHQELIDEVVARTTYGEFPEILVERELDTMLSELQEGVAAMGLSFETYLAQTKKSIAELRAQWQPKALERIRAGLALRAIAQKEKITVTEEEVVAEVNEVLRNFAGPKEAEQRLDADALRDLAAGTIRNRKVFDLLETLAPPARP